MSDSDSEYDSALGSEIDSVYSAEADSPTNYLSDYRWLDKLLDDIRERDKRWFKPHYRLQPQNILDINLGDVQWADSLASKFPLASVDAAVFNNLGPYYVESPNIEVFCIDLDQPLYRDDYDIVSIRYVAGMIEPSTFYKHIHNVAKPGGWIECLEQEFGIHGPASPRSSLSEFMKEIHDVSTRELNIAPHLSQYLQEAGFVDISIQVIKFPLSEKENMQIVRRTFDAYAQGLLGTTEATLQAKFAKDELSEEDFVQSVYVRARKL